MTHAQYRLHRMSTARAAMRASALYSTLSVHPAAGVRSGGRPAPDLAGVSDPSPGREPHDRAPELRVDADMAERIERLRAVA